LRASRRAACVFVAAIALATGDALMAHRYDELLQAARIAIDPDRLRVEIDIASDVWEAAVPPFVLQPLIENAVRHAIAPRESGGAITIEGGRSGDTLRVSIVDDGPGVAEGSRSNGNGRIGLANTRDRLRVLYGDRGQLALVNVPGGGTRATVEIPFRRR